MTWGCLGWSADPCPPPAHSRSCCCRAVPVASCTLNLDWDDEWNPIEVWQCSALRRLRISSQLPLAAGQQFRHGRLQALEVRSAVVNRQI